jgi:hypothetical protein
MILYQFPLGIAKNEYFCNRVLETEQLIRNIKSCTHTVIISPRRYGKTSLAYRAIHECGLPYVKIDLYMATDHKDIERAIIKGVNAIIAQVTGVTDKILNSIKSYMKTLKPTLEMGSDGIKLVLEASSSATPTENICEALQILNVILEKKEQKAVLLIDEFQEVERVAKNQGIEGAIRHVAQETENFAIIFSGSKRSLLKSMFNDRNKPLYRLCDEIVLDRIGENDYFDFVNKFAKKKWRQPIPPETFHHIIECTEQHPYYFNALLRSIFLLETLPTQKDITHSWLQLAEKKRNDLFHETDILNVIQKKLLIAIANGINQELTSKNFLNEYKMASSSVIRGLEELIEEDFIEKKGEIYQLVDPLMKAVITHLMYLN